MNITEYLIVFGAGLIAGITIILIAQKIHSGESLNLLAGLTRVFSAIIGKKVKQIPASTKKDDNEQGLERAVDPREQDLYNSAQTIRNILLILTTSIQRTGKAANESSQKLGNVKSAINTMDIPTDLNKAHSLLMKEIDLVISSNTNLKGELAKSQAVLNEQQQQIEALRTAVRIDGLTQIANRAYFDEKLTELISVRKRYGDPFSLLMIDLDNFKGVNDKYGHPAGDRILKGVSLKIKASLRGSDFLARFGGDEYALILIKSDVAAATEVAWKLCEEVRNSRFLLNETAVSMTLSIGVAEALEDDNEESLLKRADDALYNAKSAGRNGVSATTVK